MRFKLTEECEFAIRSLKQILTEVPVLALPRDAGMYILDTDASGDSIGAVLSRIQDQEERVICFGSRLFSTAEQNYDVTRQVLLSIIIF